jgi:hypothetical protein
MNYLNYTERKVSEEALVEIFKSHIDRNIFISEYPYFGMDGNDSFYKEFIDKYIASTKYKAQEDAIELSIAAKTFRSDYFDVIKSIIYSRRNDEIKLSCCDWLFCFFKHLSQNTFLEINEYLLEKTKDEFVKVQCMLNLFLLNNNYPIIENLSPYLNETNYPSIFYRVINGLNSISLSEKISKEIRKGIGALIAANTILTENQKPELVKLLN